MTTILKIGPADLGRPLTLQEFESSEWEEGYQYELIDGALYVSPLPNAPQGYNEAWLNHQLRTYAARRPNVINFVYNKARVFVPGRPGITIPEPDVAAYRDFPVGTDIREFNWEEINPFLVAEVLSVHDPDKDLVRNVELYFQVPAIKEYWILDTLVDPNRPHLTARRRYGKRWQVVEVAFGETYTTRTLPGFALLLDPNRW